MSSSTESTPEKIEPSQLVVQFSELYRDTIASAYDVKCSKFLGSVKHSLKAIRKLKHDLMQKHDVCFHLKIFPTSNLPRGARICMPIVF